MCLATAAQASGHLRTTRDNVNSLFGWGSPETRGETKSSSVTNVYNYGNLASDAASKKNRDTLSAGGKG